MAPKILDVGNCTPDHGAIKAMLQSHFNAEVTQAESAKQAAQLLQESKFDLILVNRIFDATGESGLELIQSIATQQPTQPVMLISNYEEHQAKARTYGAKLGFGKAAINSDETMAKIQAALTESPLGDV